MLLRLQRDFSQYGVATSCHSMAINRLHRCLVLNQYLTNATCKSTHFIIFPLIIMPETTQEVATINMDMLDRALKTEGGTESVMNMLHNFKVYNPKMGTDIDPDKAGKFRIIESVTGNELFLDGPFKFNPLNVAFFHSGSIYPLMDNGTYADEKVFFFTNEFGKFAKKTDTVGLAAKNKAIGFFQKGEFENMIKSPNLNGGDNQFFEKKKTFEGKPYNGSLLKKGAVIYGQFVGGQYDGEYFRMFTSMNNIGVTYKDGAACEADEGTFEYAVKQGLATLNEALVANGRKAIQQINPDQVDLQVTIRQNAKGNFLPVFEFAGLVAARGYDNQTDVKYIHDLKEEHFMSIFGAMPTPTPILIEGNNASVHISQPQLKAPTVGTADTKFEEEAEIIEAEFGGEGDPFAAPVATPEPKANSKESHEKAATASGLKF